MAKRFIVELTDEHPQELLKITSTGKAAAYKIKHANILLRSDANADAWSDKEVAQALGCHGNTIANVRQRYVDSGLQAAIDRKKHLHANRWWMVRWKPKSSPSAAVVHPKDSLGGRSHCLQTNWSS